MECDKDKETSPPESPPVMEDTILDDNQDDVDIDVSITAATAVASGMKDSEENTDAQSPAQPALTIASSANTLAETAKKTTTLDWGQGHVVNSSTYVPDDSETTADARNMVMDALAQRHFDDVDESVLDNSVEFVLSRLNRH